MQGKIKAVLPSNRDSFNRSDDLIDGSSVTSLFETASPIKIITSRGISKEKLAEHFGGIGKRLDEAYAQGKFTKDEYDELNAGLDEYIIKMTSRNEKMTAVWEMGKERMESSRAANLAAGITVTKGDIRPLSEIQDEINSALDQYVERACKIDRDSLYNMINNIRHNK